MGMLFLNIKVRRSHLIYDSLNEVCNYSGFPFFKTLPFNSNVLALQDFIVWKPSSEWQYLRQVITSDIASSEISLYF